MAVMPRIRDRRLHGGVGSRELFSLLCEALAGELGASDCLVSRIDADRAVAVDHAGYTRVPYRWEPHAREYALAEYPATRAVIETGRPYTTAAADPSGDPAEQRLMHEMGVTATLVLRLKGADGCYLVEVWSDAADEPFTLRDMRRARALVRRAERLHVDALARDAAEELRFRLAAAQARELGSVDERLVDLTEAVAEAMRLSEEELREARLVALVAESGKAAIPQAMLDKREPLSPVEWAVMRRQPVVGRRILERRAHLRPAAESFAAIREHWDGSGYPRGTAAEQIPLASRIVSVCAAYRAMRRGRTDRRPLEHDDAIAELMRSAGTQFDPHVVAAAVRTIDRDGPRPILRLRVAPI
jgi:HD domain